MSLADRLRSLTDALPPGGSVLLTREALLELLAKPDEPLAMDLTANQAARLLGVSEATVRRSLESGALRGFKRGSTWCVPADAVAEYRVAKREKPRTTLRAVPVRRRESA